MRDLAPASTLLTGLSVLDASRTIAGLFCGKLLADLGAGVTRVHRSGATELPGVDPERAARWLRYLDVDKQQRTLSDTREQARQELVELCRGADILIESFPGGPGEADEPAELHAAPRAAAPQLVVTSISPFGRTGPYRDWRSDEAVEYAMGGQMYLSGDRAKSPLLLSGMQGQLHAGLQAAVATLAAARHARLTGEGQEVEVSVFESLLSAHNWTTVAWTHRGQLLRRSHRETVRCKDGFMVFVPRLYNPNLFVLMGRPELAEDERFSAFLPFVRNNRAFWALFEEWAKDYSRMEIWEAGQTLRIPCCPVLSIGEVLRLPGPEGRAALRETPAGPLPVSAFTLSSGAPPALGTPPPAPVRRTSARVHEDVAAPGPLTGIRVVELTTNWAGPLAGRHLGDLGAEVIKVELARKPASRGSYYAGDDPQRHHYNRSGYFNKMNRNKRDLSLDISHPRGREVFLRLVDWADVVLENNSPRVMPNLGLDYATLAGRKPAIIMASISAFGARSPYRDYIAFGTNVEGTCGLVSLNGYNRDALFGSNVFYPDPITGSYAAAAIIAALEARDRTGAGAYIDLALQDCAASFLAEPVLEYLEKGGSGEAPEPCAARDDAATLRGIFQSKGDDDWLAVAVRAGDDFGALGRLIGLDVSARSFEGLRSGEGRAALDGALAAWAAARDHREAARALQGIGVAAGPVLKSWELLSDNHLHARGFFQYISHPEVGTWPFPGFPWKLSRTPARVYRPAPLFAEHNDEILRDDLCLDEATIAELDALGLTSREPITPVMR